MKMTKKLIAVALVFTIITAISLTLSGCTNNNATPTEKAENTAAASTPSPTPAETSTPTPEPTPTPTPTPAPFFEQIDNNGEEITILDGSVAIPADYHKGDNTVKKVTIAASVTTIEAGAFADCENLETVVFENEQNIANVGTHAFWKTKFAFNRASTGNLICVINDTLVMCNDNDVWMNLRNEMGIKKVAGDIFVNKSMPDELLKRVYFSSTVEEIDANFLGDTKYKELEFILFDSKNATIIGEGFLSHHSASSSGEIICYSEAPVYQYACDNLLSVDGREPNNVN